MERWLGFSAMRKAFRAGIHGVSGGLPSTFGRDGEASVGKLIRNLNPIEENAMETKLSAPVMATSHPTGRSGLRPSDHGSGGRPPVNRLIATGFDDEGRESDETSDDVSISDNHPLLDVTTCLGRAMLMSHRRHQSQADGMSEEAAKYAALKIKYLAIAIATDQDRRVRVRGSEVGWLWSVRFRIRGQRTGLHVPKRALVDVIAEHPDCLVRPDDRLDHWCHFTSVLEKREWTESTLVTWLKLLGALEVPPELRNRGRQLVTRHSMGNTISRWDLSQLQRKVEAWRRKAK
jgi:hypothetical protein